MLLLGASDISLSPHKKTPPVIGRVNEDYAVRKSASERRSVISNSPRSVPAQQFLSIAAGLAGEDYRMRIPLTSRLFNFLRF